MGADEIPEGATGKREGATLYGEGRREERKGELAEAAGGRRVSIYETGGAGFVTGTAQALEVSIAHELAPLRRRHARRVGVHHVLIAAQRGH